MLDVARPTLKDVYKNKTNGNKKVILVVPGVKGDFESPYVVDLVE